MYIAVILLQIVMVSPGTHLVKNHESQSRTIESQFKKKQWVPASFVTTHLLWGQTPKLFITVYWNKNILLLLQSTTKTKRNRRCLTTATDNTQTGYSTKTSSDQSIDLCILWMHTTNYFVSLGFYSLGRQDVRRGNKITAVVSASNV